MSYLKTVPRVAEPEAVERAVTVVSRGSRDVVYLEQAASIEIITEALKAWGLRVRAERASAPAPALAPAAPGGAPAEATWQTTRPEGRAPTRLENVLSPLWFPIRETAGSSDGSSAWGWFSRAA